MTNRYLAKLAKALENGARDGCNFGGLRVPEGGISRRQKALSEFPSKPSKPTMVGYEGFEGDLSVRFRRQNTGGPVTLKTLKIQPHRVDVLAPDDGLHTPVPPYADALAKLLTRCPDGVDLPHWEQAVDDGRRFLERWGIRAARLGWPASDLFDFTTRLDLRGLVWFLHGNAVSQLDATSAAYITPSGSRLVYRRANRGAGEMNDAPGLR
jgi:hypothetical protein